MPLEQTGNAITFYAFYTDSGQGKTGLTVTASVIEVQVDGTATEIVTDAAATEVGRGVYRYLLASGSVGEEGEYIAIFETSGTVDQDHIAACWVIERAGIENLDASIQTVDTVADGIKAVTDNLPDSGALSTIDTNVGAILADTGTDGVAISQSVQQAIADEVLTRGVGNVEDSAESASLGELLLGAFESEIDEDADEWVIYKTDHITVFARRTLTLSNSARLITGVT